MHIVKVHVFYVWYYDFIDIFYGIMTRSLLILLTVLWYSWYPSVFTTTTSQIQINIIQVQPKQLEFSWTLEYHNTASTSNYHTRKKRDYYT